MLDPDDVDLDELAEALDDHSADISYGHSWWFDPATGKLRLHSYDVDDETPDDLDAAGLIYVEALPSWVGYGDMEDFIEQLGAGRARNILERAIDGRGAFRRFKDALFEFPQLRDRWFAFRDERARHHAVEWLTDRGLVADQRAREAVTGQPGPSNGRHGHGSR